MSIKYLKYRATSESFRCQSFIECLAPPPDSWKANSVPPCIDRAAQWIQSATPPLIITAMKQTVSYLFQIVHNTGTIGQMGCTRIQDVREQIWYQTFGRNWYLKQAEHLGLAEHAEMTADFAFVFLFKYWLTDKYFSFVFTHFDYRMVKTNPWLFIWVLTLNTPV